MHWERTKREIGKNTYTSQGDTGTGSRRLVHLTEDESDLGLAIELNDTSLLHFVVQVVTLTGTFADTSEHRVTTVGLGDVVLQSVSIVCGPLWKAKPYNELLNEHSLADTSTSEKTNLTTTGVWGE